VKHHDELLYFHEGIDSPFSFLQNMYIPMMYQQHPMLDNIILHERAHIHYKHSYDKIMFSVLQAFFWFNPFLYLFHKEMELLHEFQADDRTAHEMETEHYVDNLLNVIRYTKTPTMLAHHFFSHPLKNRILMLYKTAHPARLQKFAALALTGLGCSVFLFMQSNAQVKKKATYYVQSYPQDTVVVENPATGEIRQMITKRDPDTIYDQVDRMPEFIGGEDALVDYLVKHVQFPESAKSNNIQGKVVVQFVVRSTGEISNVKAVKAPLHGEALSQEAIRVVSSMPRWIPGVQASKPVSVEFTLPIDFKLSK
jgi:TonB family protein